MNDVRAEVLALNPAELTPVVRIVLDDESAEALPGWNALPIGGSPFGSGAVGLPRCSGRSESASGTRRWSAVLKALRLNSAEGLDLIGAPEREVHVHRSGLLDRRPGGLRPARAYAIDDRADGSVWMWIEDPSGYDGPSWSAGHYLRAAEDIGRFNGTWTGRGLPGQSWLGRDATGW